MATETHMSRHVEALMAPQTEEERTIGSLLTELARLADRYKGDTVMVPAVVHLGQSILVLLNGELGRLDQITVDRKVHEIVTSAGGEL